MVERGDYFCDACDEVVPGSYVVRDAPASRLTGAPVCPKCNAALRWVPEGPRGPYVPALASGLRAFATRDSIVWLLAMALFCYVLGFIPFGSFLATGVMLSLGSQVFHLATDGKLELPTAVDLPSTVDFIQIIGRFSLAATLPFLPALIVRSLRPDETLVAAVLAGVGLVYLPAAMILATLNASAFAAANVPAGLALMGRVPAAYGVTNVLVMVVCALTFFGGAALVALGIPVLSGLLHTTLVLVGGMLLARVLGLFIYQHEDELGVFDYD